MSTTIERVPQAPTKLRAFLWRHGVATYYLLAIIIGTVVTAFLVVTLKSFHRTPEEAADETPATQAAATA